MSENVKFKVGDSVVDENGDTAKVIKLIGEGHIKVQWTEYNELYGTWPSEIFTLVKPAEPEITEGSLWVHKSSGVVAKVIMSNSSGLVALEAQNEVPGESEEGEIYIYTPLCMPFFECYRPYVPEQKTVKLGKWICVDLNTTSGRVDYDMNSYDSEEEARKQWNEDYGDSNDFKLLDVIKVEWEGEIPAV